jgi:hypothetical protein
LVVVRAVVRNHHSFERAGRQRQASDGIGAPASTASALTRVSRAVAAAATLAHVTGAFAAAAAAYAEAGERRAVGCGTKEV